MRWPKIERNGALVGTCGLVLWLTVMILVPAHFFITGPLVGSVIFGGYLGFIIGGINDKKLRERAHYTTSIHACLISGVLLAMLLFLAFYEMPKHDMQKIAYCALYYIAVVLVIYIIESIYEFNQKYKKERETRNYTIEHNKAVVGGTYIRLNWERTIKDNKSIVSLSTQTIYLVIKITDNRVIMKDVFGLGQDIVSIHEFPFEYKRIYNAINYDLIERMNYIKEELEEQIEKAKRAQNYIKGQD